MRAGLDARTGKLLTGWPHCVQSIRIILITAIGLMPMLRAFGSDVPRFQDDNPDPMTLMRLCTAIAAALRAWEPGFRLRTIALTRAGADGVYVFELSGIFYPRGHLGDYSLSEQRSLLVGANDNGFTMVEEAA